ncbi:MAG: hypothetical protein Kow0010_09850 [Dehalococcoidia bacterium]
MRALADIVQQGSGNQVRVIVAAIDEPAGSPGRVALVARRLAQEKPEECWCKLASGQFEVRLRRPT